MSDKNFTAKPFLKWAGGKNQLLPQLKPNYPAELGGSIKKYVEPFVGGGAVLFDILSNYELEEIYISDINEDLINTYTCVKKYVEDLISELSTLQDIYWSLDKEEQKTFFLKKRLLFNELKEDRRPDNLLTISTLFIFLNKTCFNGLYRLNRKGQYNVPIGSYKKPNICDKENLLAVSKSLENVIIKNASFKESISTIDISTFVYFDPPYRPLSNTSNFTSYTSLSFGDKEQVELANFCKAISNLGAKWLLSNSDPTQIDTSDMFFDNLYKDFNIRRIYANRFINSKTSNRGKIYELLINNY